MDAELQALEETPIRININSSRRSSVQTSEDKPGKHQLWASQMRCQSIKRVKPKMVSANLGAGNTDQTRQARELAATIREGWVQGYR